MKKILIILALLVGMLGPAFALAGSAGAVNVFQACSGNDGANNGAGAGNSQVCQEQKSGGNSNPIINALKVALEIISIIVGFAAVVMIVLGGIKMTMSGGDPSNVKSGRDTVIYSLIGVVIALFAQIIVVFVLDKLK